MWTDLLYEVTKDTNEKCRRMGHTWGEPRKSFKDELVVSCTWCEVNKCPDCDSHLISGIGGGVVCSNKCGYWFCF